MGCSFLRARAIEIHFTVTAGPRGGKRQATFFEETRKQGNTNLETALYRYTNLETALYILMITFYCAKRSFRLWVPESGELGAEPPLPLRGNLARNKGGVFGGPGTKILKIFACGAAKIPYKMPTESAKVQKNRACGELTAL